MKASARERGQAEGGGRGFDAGANVGRGDAAHPKPERKVLANALVRVQRVVLEHHREIASLGWYLGHILPVDQDATARGHFEPGDDPQHGGLAAARRPDERKTLTVADVEINAPEDGLPRPECLSMPSRRMAAIDAQPLTAPAVNPLTIRRWNARTITATGSEATTAAASTWPHGT